MTAHGFQRKTITPSPDLARQLHEARMAKKLSFEEVELATRIRTKWLQAMEDNSFDTLPPSHAKGFMRGYADFLGVSLDACLDPLVTQTAEPTKASFVPYTLEREARWSITPKGLATVFSVVVLLGFVGYISYQVKQFAAPPELTITKPAAQSSVTVESITIEGKTDPGATVSIDSLNATVTPTGTFSYPLTLRPGLNQITVHAENRIKKEAVRSISVLYQPASS